MKPSLKKLSLLALAGSIALGGSACSSEFSQKVEDIKADVSSASTHASADSSETPASTDGMIIDGTQSNYYKVIGEASFLPECDLLEGEFHYSGQQNSNGQIGVACATITKKVVQDVSDAKKANDGKRLEKPNDPYVWPKQQNMTQPRTQGEPRNSHLWERSHLIADSLGGSAKADNMVAGTRFQNVGEKGYGGMAYGEEKVRQFMNNNAANSGANSCPVRYSAQPLYNGSEGIPRTVEVNILSCDGSINEKVVVTNQSMGIGIDYTTGVATTSQ